MGENREVLRWSETLANVREMEVTKITESQVFVTCVFLAEDTDTRQMIEETVNLCYGVKNRDNEGV